MARKYDHEYKVQAVKLAKEIGGAKAAKECPWAFTAFAKATIFLFGAMISGKRVIANVSSKSIAYIAIIRPRFLLPG